MKTKTIDIVGPHMKISLDFHELETQSDGTLLRNVLYDAMVVEVREVGKQYAHMGRKISSLVSRIAAPPAHRFAAGLTRVTKRDLARAAKEDKGVLDRPFQGCTPLDLAICCDNVNGLKVLLKLGADPNNKSGIAWDMTYLSPGEEEKVFVPLGTYKVHTFVIIKFS